MPGDRKQQKEKMKSCTWPGADERKETGLKLSYCRCVLELTALKTTRHCHSFTLEEECENRNASLPNL